MANNDGAGRPIGRGTLATPNSKTGAWRKVSPSPTGQSIRKGTLTQSRSTGRIGRGDAIPGVKVKAKPQEMLSPRQLKNMLPSEANANIPSTTSTKGKISTVRQVRQSTISPVNGNRIGKDSKGLYRGLDKGTGTTSSRGGSKKKDRTDVGRTPMGGGGGASLFKKGK
jgi:hypothetical protein